MVKAKRNRWRTYISSPPSIFFDALAESTKWLWNLRRVRLMKVVRFDPMRRMKLSTFSWGHLTKLCAFTVYTQSAKLLTCIQCVCTYLPGMKKKRNWADLVSTSLKTARIVSCMQSKTVCIHRVHIYKRKLCVFAEYADRALNSNISWNLKHLSGLIGGTKRFLWQSQFRPHKIV
jgi:hypothetical protein